LDCFRFLAQVDNLYHALEDHLHRGEPFTNKQRGEKEREERETSHSTHVH
jgi:hypothetical protein